MSDTNTPPFAFLWKIFHATMELYPDAPTQSDANALQVWLVHFCDALPEGEGEGACHCRTEFIKLVRFAFPPNMTGKKALVKWGQTIHDIVSLRLGKGAMFAESLADPTVRMMFAFNDKDKMFLQNRGDLDKASVKTTNCSKC